MRLCSFYRIIKYQNDECVPPGIHSQVCVCVGVCVLSGLIVFSGALSGLNQSLWLMGTQCVSVRRVGHT